MVAIAAPAAGGEVTVEFHDGLVTLRAREASVRQILEEWSRIGNTRLVNIDKVSGEPVTLELTRVPEKQAIAVLLRSAAGYMAAPRQDSGGVSHFAQIRLMPPSVAPPPSLRQPGARPVVRRPPMLQPQLPQMLVDDQGNPVPPPGYPYGAQDGQPDPAVAGEPMMEEPVGDGQVEPEALPYPGVQPYPGPQPYAPAAGDPPPPEPEDVGAADEGAPVEEPEIVEPGPSPTPGAVVAPVPGQLPAPNPQDRRPRR